MKQQINIFGAFKNNKNNPLHMFDVRENKKLLNGKYIFFGMFVVGEKKTTIKLQIIILGTFQTKPLYIFDVRGKN